MVHVTLDVKPDMFSLTALLAACRTNLPSNTQAVHYAQELGTLITNFNTTAKMRLLIVEIVEVLLPLVENNYGNFMSLLHSPPEIRDVFQSKWGNPIQ